ncbi:MAG TPA: D-2-hydroxyacid dehydrogenase family protein [Pseudonocardiaceae bacterium]|nr:D-2-hydroxyacid dehydrogenase family protein [Pseudonocardiaceae bacterium]
MRVAILDDYQSVALASADFSALTGKAEVVAFRDHLVDEAEVAARLADFDVVIAMRERTPFRASLLDRLPNLRLLITAGMANASIDIPAARRNGVTVCGTGGSRASTAELVWALLMALVRRIPAEDAAVRAGAWQTTIGPELAGSTLGIVGLGNLGQAIGRYARAFDMRLLAWSTNLTADVAAAHGAELVGKRELFERSDIVSVHLKLSDRTTGLIGAAELAALGSRGYLVNTSRGPIVDEAALVAALREGTIAGAGLDVFDVEPLPLDHPLRTLPNTVVTPHIGFVSEQSYARIYGDAIEDVVAWLDGSPVRVLD